MKDYVKLLYKKSVSRAVVPCLPHYINSFLKSCLGARKNYGMSCKSILPLLVNKNLGLAQQNMQFEEKKNFQSTCRHIGTHVFIVYCQQNIKIRTTDKGLSLFLVTFYIGYRKKITKSAHELLDY